MYTVLCICTGSDEVDLASLYTHVVPCIIHWEHLGVHLGLEPHHLGYISKNHAHNPDRTNDCCRDVLMKWLELECSPTWGKLEDAVNTIENLLTIENNITGKCLNYQLSIKW